MTDRHHFVFFAYRAQRDQHPRTLMFILVTSVLLWPQHLRERTYMREDLFWFTGSENSNPSRWENSKVHDGGHSRKRLLTSQQRREWRTRLDNLQKTVSIVTYIHPPGPISWRFYRHLKQHPSSGTRHNLWGDILKFPNFGSCDGFS